MKVSGNKLCQGFSNRDVWAVGGYPPIGVLEIQLMITQKLILSWLFSFNTYTISLRSIYGPGAKDKEEFVEYCERSINCHGTLMQHISTYWRVVLLIRMWTLGLF